jgi:hypothetical protein
MDAAEFNALLSRSEPARLSIVAGSLLVEDRAEPAIRNTQLYLKRIVAGIPQVFRTEWDLFQLMSEGANVRKVAEARMESMDWPPERLETTIAE